LYGIILYFEKYRNEDFESSMMPKSLAFDMSIEPTLLTKCRNFRKRQYD